MFEYLNGTKVSNYVKDPYSGEPVCVGVACHGPNYYLNEVGFLMALCICMAIFLMPVFSRELRQSKSILLGYWFVITLHQIIAFTNAMIKPIVLYDARGFQLWSEELATTGEWKFAMGAEFYTHLLGAFYRWLGPSHLLGEQLSVLAFAFSCIIFLKVLHHFEDARLRLFCLLIFGALPTMLILGSVTVREPYQILFFMLAVYFGVKMHMQGGVNVYLVAMIMSALAMGMFHQGLLIYGAFMVVFFMLWSLRPTSRFGNIKKLRLMAGVVIPVAMTGLVIISKTKFSGAKELSRLLDNNWLEVAATFRGGSIYWSGRTTYGIPLDISSPIMTVYSSFKLYVYYLFSPFPWQIKNVFDAYAATESILRLFLICFAIQHWRNTYSSQRRLLGLMLILYVSMTFMWAMGTTNYGTAIRHHMLSWWILVITGGPQMFMRLMQICKGLTARRKLESLEGAP